MDNIFGVSQEELDAHEVEAPQEDIEGAIETKLTQFLERSDDELRSMISSGDMDIAKNVANLPLLPTPVKAAALLFGPFEFLTDYLMKVLLGPEENDLSVGELVGYCHFLAWVMKRSVDDVDAKFGIDIMTGMLQNDPADPYLSAEPTQLYTIRRHMLKPGFGYMIEVADRLVALGLFDRLGITFGDDAELYSKFQEERDT